MAMQVCAGATLACSFGSAPCFLRVTLDKQVLTGFMPAASIDDHQPVVNIDSFGMCSSLSNPAVASATSAAQGVLTPVPCVPSTCSPWISGAPSVVIGNIPALNDTSTLMCEWLGVISVTEAGQGAEQIP